MTPAISSAAAEAEGVLHRVSLPSPPVETTPYLATATEIVQHHLCPRRYHLRYRIGAPTPEFLPGAGRDEEDEAAGVKDDELPAEVLGDRVHRILAEAPGSPLIEAILGTLSPSDRSGATQQVETFLAGPLGREAASGKALRELPFVMARRGAAVRGQIDLILAGRDGDLKVVDYKTSRIAAAEVEEKAGDYELQLRIYALAVREIFGRAPSGAFLHFLHPDVVREVEISPAALEQAEGIIAGFFEAHRSGDYPQNVAPHCRACGFARTYCAGVEARIPAAAKR